MTKRIALTPKGYRSATPVLIVRGCDAALDWYEQVFGAAILSRNHDQDGVTVLKAEMKIGNSILRLGDEIPAFGLLSPAVLGGSPTAVHLYVEDVDAVWTKALEAGAMVATPLADVYWGERFGRFVDPFGHVWSLAQRLETLSAAEIKAREEALLTPAEPVEGAAVVEPVIPELSEVAA